jgi:hypothetical protein
MSNNDKSLEYYRSMTVDCTPTWRSIIDIHAQAYATGSLAAQAEIHRCAGLADGLIAVQKHVETLGNTPEMIALRGFIIDQIRKANGL